MQSARTSSSQAPQQDLARLAEWGTDNLTRVIAIDSHSEQHSDSIPSTEGQRHLSDALRQYFADLGYSSAQDDYANLLVTIPSNLASDADCPKVALMVHLDTSEGTRAVPALAVTAAWDGKRIAYPANERITVTVDNYPETAFFLGHDLLHGPGDFPIGLDDKLGMAQLMTLARILAENPALPHGELVLVFRPDEEIGRMAAVDSLADELARRGVRYGYTIDGILPFEVNVENFYASTVYVDIVGEPSAPVSVAGAAQGAIKTSRHIALALTGVNTHGATAKSEGHYNSLLLVTRAMAALAAAGEIGVTLVDFASDSDLECNAAASFLIQGATEAELEHGERALLDAIEAEVAPHAWKGASVSVRERGAVQAAGEEGAAGDPRAAAKRGNAGSRLLAHLQAFLRAQADGQAAIEPLLAEDSDGRQGYSNPCFVGDMEGGLRLTYRLRDFDAEGLEARENHVRAVCRESGVADDKFDIIPAYVNMGPNLQKYPELVDWARAALGAIEAPLNIRPIRGGTGVDPFLARDIPIANLGTGYFAPESEKEFTSRQSLARHSLWLAHLVQIIAGQGDGAVAGKSE